MSLDTKVAASTIYVWNDVNFMTNEPVHCAVCKLPPDEEAPGLHETVRQALNIEYGTLGGLYMHEALLASRLGGGMFGLGLRTAMWEDRYSPQDLLTLLGAALKPFGNVVTVAAFGNG